MPSISGLDDAPTSWQTAPMARRVSPRGPWLGLLALTACSGNTISGGDAGPGFDAGPRPDAGSGTSAAALVTHTLPAALGCGESANATATFRHAGGPSWTRERGFALAAALGPEDPLARFFRVEIPEGVTVRRGEQLTFDIGLQAPGEPDAYTTVWRMTASGGAQFGEALMHEVAVDCEFTPPPLDLATVTWLHADVSGWPETSTLAPIELRGSPGEQICFAHTRADAWPAMMIDGAEVHANPWIFIYRDRRWYGATWEWLRPGMPCKFTSSVSWMSIQRPPFDATSRWLPRSGETYYVMVSGLARTDARNVMERSNPVRVVWP